MVSTDSLYPAEKDAISPRVGVTWVPTDSRKTVIRGGYGLFYDMFAVAFFTANTGFANGGALGVGNNPGGDQPVYSITQRRQTVVNNVPIFGTTSQPPYGAFAVSQDLKLPYVINFNVNVEQQLGPTTIAQIGYVGTRGHRLALMRDINAATPGATLAQARRPFDTQYPNLASINELESIGRSEYNSLQMSLIQSAWHGVSGRLNYTLSHAMDNGSEARNTLPMIQDNIDADWGNAAFDIRHVLTAGFTYNLPARGTSRWGDGWQINTIATFQSGSPFTITTGTDASGTGVRSDRPNLVGDPYAGVVQPTTTPLSVQWFNPAAFAQPAAGTFGNLERNALYGPGFKSVDVSVFKTTKLSRGASLQLRLEMLQPVQHDQLGEPRRRRWQLDDLRGHHQHAQREQRAGHRRRRAAQRAAGGEVHLLRSAMTRVSDVRRTAADGAALCPAAEALTSHVPVGCCSFAGARRAIRRRRAAARARAAGARRRERLRRAALAEHRPVPRRTRERRQRRARPAEHVLLRLGRRRRLEDDQRRPHLAAGLRLAAGRVDRRDRRRAVERRTSSTSAPASPTCGRDLVRQRHVQVDRRRQDVDAPRPRQHAADRPRRRRSARTRTSSSSRRSATSTARTPIAASSARATAARRGRRCSSRTTTSAPSTSRSIRRTRRSSTRRSGTRGVRRGTSTRRRTARAAASSSRPTAARPGSRSTRGLPTEGVGRIGIAVAPTNRTRVYAVVDAKDGGLYRSDDAGATLAQGVGRRAHLGTRLVLREGRRRSEEPRPRLRVEHRRLSLAGRRQDVRRAVQGIARRRRLPPAVDLARRRQPHDSRRRPGRGHQRRRADRASDVELVAEPADGADLSRLRGLPRSRTG